MSAIDVQRSVKENLLEFLKSHDKVQIVGPKGSGRMFTVKSLGGEYHVLEVGSAARDDSLQIIYNALFAYRDRLNLSEISYNLSFGVCSRASIGLSLKNTSLVDDEKTLIRRLKKLSRPNPLFGKITPIIIAIRKEVCTERINNFLKLALKTLNADGDRLKVVYLTETTDIIQNVEQINMPLISASVTSPRTLLLQLNLKQEILDKLTDEEVSFIFNICMNNFSDILTIIRELNDNTISFTNPHDAKDSISRILNNCFEKLGMPRGREIITYCSHANKENTTLTQNELEYLIGVGQRDLDNELDNADKLNIIKKRDKYIEIIIKLVGSIAINESYDRQHEIYTRFYEMLAYLYPSNYATKYKFALRLNAERSSVVKMQYCLQQIRLRHSNIDLSGLPSNMIEFVKDYSAAVSHCIRLDYVKAIELLGKYIRDTNQIIAAEAALIIAQAKMKSLDENERTDALNLLETINAEQCDGNLNYRIRMCRMSAFVHKGKYERAIQDYNELYSELNLKVSNHPSDELKYNLNILLRKANMVYNFQAAKGCVSSAKNYFKQNQSNFTDYFYALCNSLCSNIENMDLANAEKDVIDFGELQSDHVDIIFKRQYIFDNNEILYEYFSGKETAGRCAEKLQALLSKMDDYADKFLVASNYAVMLAISGDVKSALNYMENNLDCGTSDAEGVYEYRSVVNASIMQFILDNDKKDNIISRLKSITIDPEQPNKAFKEREINVACNVMKTCRCSSATEWVNLFKSNMPKNRPLNIFEQGFVITPLSNWDDD